MSVSIVSIRGGRNGADSPTAPNFPDDQVVDAVNVDCRLASCGGRRGGSDTVATTGGTAFANGLRTLCRHMPDGDDGHAELWAIDGNGLVKRNVAGVWSDVALDDPITGNIHDVQAVSFNGKLVFFYKSAVDRLHVWDPLSGRVRRHGINPGTTGPTVANTGSGSYPASARRYRARFLQMDGTRIVRRSEPTPSSASFTPSGTGLAAQVTRPAAPGEAETHWEVEVSQNGTVWNVLAGAGPNDPNSPIPIGTTTFDDDDATSTYTSQRASDLSGMYSLFPSVKFGVTDTNRLIAAGSFNTTTTREESRLWFTPPLGSDDAGDDERWVNQTDLKTRADITERDGGSITGIGGTVNGVFWVFKYRQVWRFVPTEDLFKPYIFRKISSVVGAISHRGIVMTEDVNGAPVLAFWSARGPCRCGLNGIEFMGRDLLDVLKGQNGYAKPNLSATIVVHGVYHEDEEQLWYWLATGTSDTPNLRLRLDVKQATRQDRYGVRGGWFVDNGDAAKAYASCVFANTIAATMSKDLKPYFGFVTTTALYKGDTTSKTDNGTAFEAYWVSKNLGPVSETNRNFQIERSTLTARAQAGGIVQQALLADYDKRRSPATVALDPQKTESRVVRDFGASMVSDVGVVQVRLGDIGAMGDNAWQIESWSAEVKDAGNQEHRG